MRLVLPAVSVLGVFFVAAAAAALVMVYAGVRRTRERKAFNECHRFLQTLSETQVDTGEIGRLVRPRLLTFLHAYVRIMSHITLADRIREAVEAQLLEAHVDIQLVRELSRRSVFRRSRAALFLGYIPSAPGGAALDHLLQHEKSDRVRLRIIYAIVRQRRLTSVPTVFDSLKDSSPEYRERATGMLLDLGYDLVRFLDIMRDRTEPELQMVFVRAAGQVPTAGMRDYLEHLVDHGSQPVSREAFAVLINRFYDAPDAKRFMASKDSFFANLAIEARGRFPSKEVAESVLPYLAVDETRKSAVVALTSMITSVPRLLPDLVERFRNPKSSKGQQGLAEVLAVRAEYILHTALREKWPDAEYVLGSLLKTRKATGILSFLNDNTDTAREREACALIRKTVRADSWLREELGLYAKDSVLRELGLRRREVSRDRGERSGENPGPRLVATIVAGSIILPLAVFAGLWWFGIGTLSEATTGWWRIFEAYFVWFERLFVLYAFSLNSVYLVLLVAAIFAVIESQRFREVRPIEMLFKPGLLPSVSIIAPAYNEEATIVESVNALLNLRYPDYEVIVVNDGSLDGTIDRLIATFELKRTSLFMHDYLSTRPVRGLYRNPRIPGLLVVDKSNGGKADSLNAGINASRKSYYAAIDADSLLEPDAILHLATEALESEVPVAATGGNVLPINGCRVNRGSIDEIGLPHRWLPRFQTVEYIRGFMTGRIGWARLDSLLIISGAFGLFNKQQVVDAGGYLTSSERFLKDTVAEDMELVVRLTRTMRQQGGRGTIRYAPAANCWTEVPESAGILASQRDRWQRGLIDVLFYHARMTLRRRFGRPGTVGMPYHYIFELVGPWLEIQGYVFLIAAAALGVLPFALFVAVLVSSIGMGVIVSLLSLQLAEWHRPLFRRRDRLLVLIFAVLENFGYRQLASVFRLRAYISVIRQRTGWGTMRRRGFHINRGTNA